MRRSCGTRSRDILNSFFFLGQATGPQLLGSILKSHGYAAAFIVAGAGLFTTATVSSMLFARAKTNASSSQVL